MDKRYAAPMSRASLTISLLALCGCGDSPQRPAATSTLEVRDSLDRPVRLAAPPSRVLSLAPGNTEIVFALGAADLLVGRTGACDFPPEVASVTDVGSLFPPELERILSTRPELALMIDGNLSLRRALVARGVPVFVYQPRTLTDAFAGIRAIATLLGRRPAGDRLTDGMRARIDTVTRRAPQSRPRVFYEVWPEPLTTAGPRTFLSDLIRVAGGDNVVTDATSDWPRYPLERLVTDDPDVVLTAHRSTETGAATRPGWSSLRAVRGGRLIRVPDPDLFARAGPRVVEGVEWLSAALHR